MKRKFYQTMLDWKKTSYGRTALMIDGARRVGKSYLAEEFAKREYDAYLLIDFSKVKPKSHMSRWISSGQNSKRTLQRRFFFQIVM